MTDAKCKWAAQGEKLSKYNRQAWSTHETDFNLALVLGYAWLVQNA